MAITGLPSDFGLPLKPLKVNIMGLPNILLPLLQHNLGSPRRPHHSIIWDLRKAHDVTETLQGSKAKSRTQLTGHSIQHTR
jgi:hypothetical protein